MIGDAIAFYFFGEKDIVKSAIYQILTFVGAIILGMIALALPLAIAIFLGVAGVAMKWLILAAAFKLDKVEEVSPIILFGGLIDTIIIATIGASILVWLGTLGGNVQSIISI